MTYDRVKVVTAGSLPSSFPRDEFEGLVAFEVAQTDEELRTLVVDAEVLYGWQVPDTVPARTPRLRWIQVPSAGVDHLRNRPVWDSDIVITSSTGIHTVPMTEHLFSLLLALSRTVPSLVRSQDRHEWAHDRPHRHGPGELRGSTMGIIGWGKIGDGIAHVARAFGMRVVGTRWSVVVSRQVDQGGVTAFEDAPWLEPVDASPDIVYPGAQLHEVLGQSDVVVLLLPLTEDTHRSFSRAEFEAMRRGALFFNFGRGPVVDEEALIDALRSGRLGGAGLDVFAQEPLPRSSPLWSMQNVIVSPHLGGVSSRTRERTARLFAINLARYCQKEPLFNVVDRSRGY